MDISIINKIRVIIPTEGMWLCNEAERIISDKVFLGINATETDWTEITEKRKAELEALWETGEIPEDIATESDYINALESLGVDFNG